MECAFSDVGKPPVEAWYHKNGPVQDLREDFSDQKPLVYHVFGSMKDLKSLVLAENDFVDLLVSVIKGNPGLPERLFNAFSAECSMLFLGSVYVICYCGYCCTFSIAEGRQIGPLRSSALTTIWGTEPSKESSYSFNVGSASILLIWNWISSQTS